MISKTARRTSVAVATLIVTGYFLYCFISDNYFVYTLDLGSFHYKDTPAEKKRALFDSENPTEQEIRAWISDKTIIGLDRDQAFVEFISHDGSLYRWIGDDLQIAKWKIKDRLQLAKLGEKRKISPIRVLCIYGIPEKNDTRCDVVYKKFSLYNVGFDSKYYDANGDILGMSKWSNAPFLLPSTVYSIDSIQALINEHRKG